METLQEVPVFPIRGFSLILATISDAQMLVVVTRGVCVGFFSELLRFLVSLPVALDS